MLLILGDGHGPGIPLALSALASLAAELGLTAREREGLEHLAPGMAAIAYPLGVAPSYRGDVGALKPTAMQSTLEVLQQDSNVVGGLVVPCDAAGTRRS